MHYYNIGTDTHNPNLEMWYCIVGNFQGGGGIIVDAKIIAKLVRMCVCVCIGMQLHSSYSLDIVVCNYNCTNLSVS